MKLIQLKKVMQDIKGFKGEWRKADIFEKYVSDLNLYVRKLELIEFKLEDFHYSNTGKTINQNGYESLLNYINILETMMPTISENISIELTPDMLEQKDKKVFIVHGRDKTAQLEMENLVRRIGLEPIVLQRMANSGLTLIEKFERHSNVKYAIVLLTPDDVGALCEDNPNYRFRARQNVIFELGFFYGKLGRANVCCVHKSSIELPSDIDGIAYLPYSGSIEEVEYPLLKELKEAKLDFQII